MEDVVDSKQYRLGNVGGFVAEHQISVFFVLALALSWIVWAPSALGAAGQSATGLAIVVGAFGPLGAAAIVTWLSGGSARAWVRRVLRWRVDRSWYLVALVVPPAMMMAVSVGYAALGNSIVPSLVVERLPVYAVSLVFVSLLGGGQEEFGWRGFALPRLLERVDAVTASLVIGVVWTAWHLPMFVTPGSSQYGVPLVAYALFVLGISIVFTWLYRNTGGSVLLAILFHGGINSSTALIAVRDVQGDALGTLHWLMAAAAWVLALGLLAAYGRSLQPGDSR